MDCKPRVFPIEDFNAQFPVFSAENSGFTQADIQLAGTSAMFHIGPSAPGMPMQGNTRVYALFLMTAHILTLHKNAADAIDSGVVPVGGRPYKTDVGSVSVENTKPNSLTLDDFTYWLDQTVYGQELMALLEVQAPLGIYLNSHRDSVRVLV